MHSSPNNIFFTIVTLPNSAHVLEIDFHLRGYSGNKSNFSGVKWVFRSQWQLRGFSGNYTL